MGQSKQLKSIFGISILSLVLVTGVLSISGFSSQSNDVIDDSIQDFTFGFIQLSSATFVPGANVITSINSDATSPDNFGIGDTITFTLSVPLSADAESAAGSYNGQSLTWTGVGAGPTFTQFTATYTVTEGDPDHKTTALQISGVTVRDTEGNTSAPAGGSDVAVLIDATRPTVTVNIIAASLSDVGLGISGVTFEFSEQVLGFDATDLTVSGVTLTSPPTNVGGNTYTASIQANDGIEAVGSVSVNSGSYTDVFGNTGSSGSDNVTIDTLNPTVTVDIIDTLLFDADNTSNITFEFSEAVTGFDATDLTVSFGTISAFTAVDGDSYTATFTANDGIEETGSVTVNADSYTDIAGNLGATGSDNVTIDTRNPLVVSGATVAVNATLINDANVTSSKKFAVTVDYDEPMITDSTADPTITFDSDVSSTLGVSPSSDEWLDSDTYRATYTLADAGVDVDAVDIASIVGARDVATNVQVDYFGGITAGPFAIDTRNPLVVSGATVAVNATLINDANVTSSKKFAVTVDYDEPMIIDGTADPTITFDSDVSSTLGASPSSDEWLDSDTYRATYTLADAEVFEAAVDIASIVGARDVATNVQVDYFGGITAGPFVIDTQNPTIVVPAEVRREGDNTSGAVPIIFAVNSNDIENPTPPVVTCFVDDSDPLIEETGVGPDENDDYDFSETSGNAFSHVPGTHGMTCVSTDEHDNTTVDTFEAIISEILDVKIKNLSPFWDEVITVNGTAFGFKAGEIINVTYGVDPLDPFDEVVIPAEADSNIGFFFVTEHAFSFVTSNTVQTVEVDLVNNPIEASAVPQDVTVKKHFTEFVGINDIGTDHWGKAITKSGTLVDLQASIGPAATGSLNPSANILISGDGKGTLPFSTTTDAGGFFSVSGNSVSRTVDAPSTVIVNVDYPGDQFFVPAPQVTDPYSTLIHPTTLILNPVESVQGGNPVTVAGQLTDNITGEIIPAQTIEFSATAGVVLSDTSTTGPVTISGGFDIDPCTNCGVVTQLLRLNAGDSITFSPTPEIVVMSLRDMAENDILATVTAKDGSVFPAEGDGKGDNTGNWRISHGSGVARIDIDAITGAGVSGIREIQLLNEHSASTFEISFNGFATATYDVLSFDDVNYDSVGTSPTGEETPFSVTASFDGTPDFDGSTSATQNSVLQSSAGASSSALPTSVISDSGVGITSVSCEGNDGDGDALCNDWEGAGNGVPYEVDGITYRYELAGTSTTTKDLLLEIDSHQFHSPITEALDNVTDAFAGAPTGPINLIIDVDDNSIPHVDLIKVWKDNDNDFTNDFSGIKSKWFGTSTERVAISETPSFDLDNQILMYNFDGNTLDSTSPSNDGTVVGTNSYDVGKMGRAFDFNGSTLIGEGTTSSWKELHGSSSTIAVWLKSSDISNTPVFVDTSNGGSFGAVGVTLFARPSGELNYQITNGGGTGPVVSIVAPGAFIADGAWHHYLVSFDESLASNNAKLYVDGVLTTQATKVQASSTSNHAKGLEIGGLGFCCKFNGEMDDLRLYDYALSDSQSTNLHDSAEGSDISLAQLAYVFDGDSLADSIGSNLAIVSGSTTYDDNGAFGDAFSLDGSNFVFTPQISSLFIDDTITISIWFNPATAGVIVDERGQDPPFDGWNDAYLEILPTGEVKARVWPIAPISLGTASFNEWHHAVLRYNGATDTLDGFLDGVKSLSSSGDRQAPQEFCCWQQYFAFGKSDTLNMGSGATLTGLIDDIRIYNTALSDTEISKLFIKKVPLGSQAKITGLTLSTPSNSVTGDKTEGRINVRLVATTAAATTFNEDSSGTSTVAGGDAIFTFDTPIVSTSSTGTPTQKSLQVSIPYLTSGIASSDNIGTVIVPLLSSKSVTGLANAAGSPTASSTLLDAKAQAYRYILFTHSIGGQSGQAELRGNDAIVALGDGFEGTVSGHVGTVGTIDQQSGTLMHELGHLLNLNHGGPRYLLSDPNTSLVATVENCVPFHNSVMSYTGQFPTYKGENWILGFSHLNGPTLSETGLSESAAGGGLDLTAFGSPYILWSTPVQPPATQDFLDGFADATAKDWSGDGDTNDSGTFDLNNFGIFGCKSSPSSSFEAHSEWTNLDFDFRQGPTGQFDASYPQVFPPGQAESINVGVQQQIITNYQTHGVEPPLKSDGTANIKPKSNVNVRVDLDDREGNFLATIGSNPLVVEGFYSLDGGENLEQMVDKDGNTLFTIKTITGGGNPDKDVWELQWRTPDLPQGNQEALVFLYLRIANPGADPEFEIIFDKTSSSFPEISIALDGKENIRTNAFVFIDEQGNRATVTALMKKGGGP